MVLSIAAPVSAQIRSDETKVYAVLINELSKENLPNSTTVMLTKTRPLSQCLLTSKADEISRLIPTATKSVISDFLNVGEKEMHFDIPKPSSSSGNSLISLSENDFVTLFKRSIKLNEAWKDFFRQFPKSHSLITFSRVGLDSESKQALVLRSTTSGGQFESGDLFLMFKKKGRWKISERVNIWIT
ncbi:hypothetical protein [Undibacterium sp. Ji22W]|uniref:hypothetical protein n=1 Tax=Undibacterium sp. Ji22W TaxID=3413038 RepID=UPI003BF3AF26